MLPVANLDYELKALGIDGVAGSGTARFRGRRPGFPGPTNISGIATKLDDRGYPSTPLGMTVGALPPFAVHVGFAGGAVASVILSGGSRSEP